MIGCDFTYNIYNEYGKLIDINVQPQKCCLDDPKTRQSYKILKKGIIKSNLEQLLLEVNDDKSYRKVIDLCLKLQEELNQGKNTIIQLLRYDGYLFAASNFPQATYKQAISEYGIDPDKENRAGRFSVSYAKLHKNGSGFANAYNLRYRKYAACVTVRIGAYHTDMAYLRSIWYYEK